MSLVWSSPSRRGATCTVAAVDELVGRRGWGRLRAMLEASLWVATGLLLTPWPAAVALAAPVAGRLADRISSALLCAIGLMALASGLVAVALLKTEATTLDIGWRMALCGLGFGFFQAPKQPRDADRGAA